MLLFDSNPVGWAGVATVATGYMFYKGFEWAYGTNFLAFQEGLDWTGDRINVGMNGQVRAWMKLVKRFQIPYHL